MRTDELLAAALFASEHPHDKWGRFKEGDVARERYLNLARVALDWVMETDGATFVADT